MIVSLVCVVLLYDFGKASAEDTACDTSRKTVAEEGNLGQTHDFSWLGVLRVHLHYESSFKVALTGLVLVQPAVALANAHDVARVPKQTFVEDSQAMFILRERTPWYCPLKEYVTHPEYQYSTVNTIALVILDLGDDEFPREIKPICWPEVNHHSEDSIYAIGYTDENMLLEKQIFRMQSVSLEMCQEFYHRAGLSDNMVEPAAYSCARAARARRSCVWDNGLALVSNATQRWTLAGLGVHGPGCGAPARFVALRRYRAWARAAAPAPARRVLNIGDILSVQPRPKGELYSNWYPFNTEIPDLIDINVTRINQSAISIRPLDSDGRGRSHFGDCRFDPVRRVVYRDLLKVVLRNQRGKLDLDSGIDGTVMYKISMFDLKFENITCVTIAVESTEPEKAYLFYEQKFEVKSIFPETPSDFFRYYLKRDRVKVKKENRSANAPHPHLRPYIKQEIPPLLNITNISVYLTIKFTNRARLHFTIYGRLFSLTTTTGSSYAKRRAYTEVYLPRYTTTRKSIRKKVQKTPFQLLAYKSSADGIGFFWCALLAIGCFVLIKQFW